MHVLEMPLLSWLILKFPVFLFPIYSILFLIYNLLLKFSLTSIEVTHHLTSLKSTLFLIFLFYTCISLLLDSLTDISHFSLPIKTSDIRKILALVESSGCMSLSVLDWVIGSQLILLLLHEILLLLEINSL